MAKAPRPPKNLKQRAHEVASVSKKGWHKSAGKVPENIKGLAFLSGPSVDALGRSYRRWKTNPKDEHGKEHGAKQDSSGKSKQNSHVGNEKAKAEPLHVTPQNAAQVVTNLSTHVSKLSKQIDTLQNKISDMHAKQNPFGVTTKDAAFDILHHQYKEATRTYNPLATKDAIPFAKNSCAAVPLHESEELHESDGACGVTHTGNNLDSPVKEFKVFANGQLHTKLANGKEGIFTSDDAEGSVEKMHLSKAISTAMDVATPELRRGTYGINGKKQSGAMEERVTNAIAATPEAAKALIGDAAFNHAALFDLVTGQKRKNTDVLVRSSATSKYPYEAILTNNKHGFSKEGSSPFVEGNHFAFEGDAHPAIDALTDKTITTIGKAIGANPKHLSELKRRRDIIKKGIKEGNTIQQMHEEINGKPVHSRGKWREVPGQHTTSKEYKVANGKENVEFESKGVFESFVSNFGHDGLTHVSDMLSQFPGESKKFIENGVSGGTYAIRSVGKDIPGEYESDGKMVKGMVPSHTFEAVLDSNKREHMEISYAKVAKESQGTDVMKTFFKGAEKSMRDLGVNTVTLTANINVGGYAWAKYGFDFHDAGDQAEYINAFKSYAGKKGYNIQNEKYASSWDIARTTAGGEKIGKDFMLDRGKNVSWKGELDLNPESKSYKQFHEYVHSSKTKAQPTEESTAARDEKFKTAEPVITDRNRKDGGASISYFVDVGDEKGVFKPDSGAAVVEPNPSGREVTVHHVAKAMGINVPLTIPKKITIDGKEEHGALIRMIPELKTGREMIEDGSVAATLKKVPEEQLAKAAVLDDIINNVDRNHGNYGVTPDGNLHLIDHGMSLFENDPLEQDTINGIRTFKASNWGFGSAVMPEHFRTTPAYKKALTEAYGKRKDISKALKQQKVSTGTHDNVMDRLEYFHRAYNLGEFKVPTGK